jgi:hypothetical protein
MDGRGPPDVEAEDGGGLRQPRALAHPPRPWGPYPRVPAALRCPRVGERDAGREPVGLRIRQAAVVLALALEAAVRDGIIARNVARGVRLPKMERREAPSLEPPQVEAIAAKIAEPYDLLVRILGTLGLRFGRLRRCGAGPSTCSGEDCSSPSRWPRSEGGTTSDPRSRTPIAGFPSRPPSPRRSRSFGRAGPRRPGGAGLHGPRGRAPAALDLPVPILGGRGRGGEAAPDRTSRPAALGGGPHPLGRVPEGRSDGPRPRLRGVHVDRIRARLRGRPRRRGGPPRGVARRAECGTDAGQMRDRSGTVLEAVPGQGAESSL